MNYDEIATEYLSSPTPALKKKLTTHGKDIVPSLLRSLVRLLATRGASVNSEYQRNEIRENRWSRFAIDPIVLPAHEVITALGVSASYELCRALLDRDRSIQKAAVLLLVLEDNPPSSVITELKNVFARTQMNNSATLMLLHYVLARGGDVRLQQAIQKDALDKSVDAETWVIRTINTVVFELLGWQKEVFF